MTRSQKYWVLALLTLVTLAAIFLVPPISQPLSYHHFADDRSLWTIPNFGNVVSNLPFIIAAIAGLVTVAKAAVSSAIRATYVLLFIGVLLTGFGSAYYHWNPNNDTLVWDRLPMTIVFMSLLSATVTELVSRRVGIALLVPLVAVGVGSVFWWHYSETLGKGDLRLYFWVQFYPMLALPLMFLFFYSPTVKPILRCLGWVVVWYVLAKIFELLDFPIYRAIWISGHTLKHLAAAVSTWYFVVLFRRQYSRKSWTDLNSTNKY
jgi:Ceramidase